MKKLTALICTLAVFAVWISPVAAAFDDMVDESHWGYAALEYAINNSVIKGFEDNTVRPSENLTRAQMAAIVVRLINTAAIADMTKFTDVDNDAWYFSSLESAVGLGLFVGNGDGHIYPNNPITRQEAFVVMSRLLELEKVSGDTAFADNDLIADWARDSIKAMYIAGYISGDNNKNVNPTNLITRIEFAQLVYNIYLKNKPDGSGDSDSEASVVSVFGKVRTGNGSGNNNSDGSNYLPDNNPHQSNVEVFFDEDSPYSDTYAYDIFED